MQMFPVRERADEFGRPSPAWVEITAKQTFRSQAMSDQVFQVVGEESTVRLAPLLHVCEPPVGRWIGGELRCIDQRRSNLSEACEFVARIELAKESEKPSDEFRGREIEGHHLDLTRLLVANIDLYPGSVSQTCTRSQVARGVAIPIERVGSLEVRRWRNVVR